MGGNSDLTVLAKGTSVAFAGIVVGVVGQFFIRIALARTLGPAGYGRLMLALSLFYLLASLSSFALNVGVARFVALFRARRDASHLKGTIKSSLRFTFWLAFGFGALLFFSARPVAHYVFHDQQLTGLLRVFAPALPFFAAGAVLIGILRGFERIGYMTLTEQVVKQAGLATLGSIAFIVTLSPSAVAAGYALVFLSMFLVGALLVRRTISEDGVDWQGTRSIPTLGRIFRFSWPLVLSQQFSDVRKRTDSLFLGYFLTSDVVGAFNVVMPVAQLLQQPLAAVNKIFMPVITRAYAREGIDGMVPVYRSAAFWTFFFTLPVYCFVVLNARVIIDTMFGQQYSDAAPALIIVASGFLLNAVSGSYGEAFIAIDKPMINMTLALAAMATNIVLDIALIPALGLEGAAWSVSLSMMVVAVGGGVTLHYLTGLQPFSVRHVPVALVTAMAMVALRYSLTGASDSIRVAGFLVGILGLLGINLAILGTLGLLSIHERNMILGVARRFH